MRAYRPRQTRWISSADFRAKSSPAGLGSTMSGAPAVPRLCQFPKIKRSGNCCVQTEELSNVPKRAPSAVHAASDCGHSGFRAPHPVYGLRSAEGASPFPDARGAPPAPRAPPGGHPLRL